MIISDNDRSSRIITCINAAPHFLLQEGEALQIVEQQICCLTENWSAVCDEASLSEVERNLLWGNQFLNPFVFEGLATDKISRPNVPFG
jgi:serine/threonine-protein kinase HipA